MGTRGVLGQNQHKSHYKFTFGTHGVPGSDGTGFDSDMQETVEAPATCHLLSLNAPHLLWRLITIVTVSRCDSIIRAPPSWGGISSSIHRGWGSGELSLGVLQ